MRKMFRWSFPCLILCTLLNQSLSKMCTEAGGKCVEKPECGFEKDCEDIEDFFEACEPIDIDCGPTQVCCTRDAYTGQYFNKQNLKNRNREYQDESPLDYYEGRFCAEKSSNFVEENISKENRNIQITGDGIDEERSVADEFGGGAGIGKETSVKAFGRKCRNAGGECRSNCLHGSLSSNDDCFLRKCCVKPPCNRSFWKCERKSGDCHQTSTCPNDYYYIANGCTNTNDNGPTCRCCAPCKRKFLQCLSGGRCTTEACNSNEVKFNSKCTSSSCHCCQQCRRSFLQCIGGYCTKEECPANLVKYKGKCAHDDCHCCASCKKKFGQCLLGRCTKEACKSDESTLQGKCTSDECHCCQKSCPDNGCDAQGGRCRPNCLFTELDSGLCQNGCRCCKKIFLTNDPGNVNVNGKGLE